VECNRLGHGQPTASPATEVVTRVLLSFMAELIQTEVIQGYKVLCGDETDLAGSCRTEPPAERMLFGFGFNATKLT
jgi:hypothetical protein